MKYSPDMTDMMTDNGLIRSSVHRKQLGNRDIWAKMPFATEIQLDFDLVEDYQISTITLN
jgi:hypothetical protein